MSALQAYLPRPGYRGEKKKKTLFSREELYEDGTTARYCFSGGQRRAAVEWLRQDWNLLLVVALRLRSTATELGIVVLCCACSHLLQESNNSLEGLVVYHVHGCANILCTSITIYVAFPTVSDI